MRLALLGILLAVFAGAAVSFGLATRNADRDLDRELNRYPTTASHIDDARSTLQRDAALTDGFAAAADISRGDSTAPKSIHATSAPKNGAVAK